jgi:hypothetical protein
MIIMVPREICDRLDEWWGDNPDAIKTACRENPALAGEAAKTIHDRLEELQAEVEPIEQKRLDAQLRVMLNSLLSVPSLAEQLPRELDEFLLGGNVKAEPLPHTIDRDRLYRTFKPIEQDFHPPVVLRPSNSSSKAAETKPAEGMTEAERPQ